MIDKVPENMSTVLQGFLETSTQKEGINVRKREAKEKNDFK
jgi:hypothetical protein